MNRSFHQRIRASLADSNLQAALDANAERRLAGRLSAFASLPDAPERRQRAHAIKADVVALLDEYLAQFIEKVTANGIRVHRAKDGDEAVEIIINLCDSAGSVQDAPRLVAKSKSMVSEEINLNHALETAGMRVVETDLGEYIVQLRGERPSHIITPAVHLRRGDVGKLFAKKLGIPYTEDIPTLTNTARKVLREVFLTADVGFSGVNFGVAETGTLCMVTNEGNGRMVTTLPPVHIALMGMERLVPGLDDLALFLSLLPRSATGQKLSVYTSLIHSPFPGQTRHLVLLDNGRSALRASPLAESLACIRCGACLNACPVFRELGGHAYGSIYPGPIGSVISTRLVDPSFTYLAQASSLCGACREACPVDIDLPGLLLRVRAGQISEIHETSKTSEAQGLAWSLKFGIRIFHRLAAWPKFFGLAQQALGLFLQAGWMRLPAWTGWGYSKDFPPFNSRPFRRRWGIIKQTVAEGNESIGQEPGKNVLEPPTVQSLVDQFTREFETLGGQVHPVSEAELPGKLYEFLKSRGIERVHVDEVGAQVVQGIETSSTFEPGIRAGVTGALAGIADTGSLVLVSDDRQPLTASLVPEIHIAVLKTPKIYTHLEQVLDLAEVREAAAGVILSGPSRTADIEMTLTIGVHGPGELHVFLVSTRS